MQCLGKSTRGRADRCTGRRSLLPGFRLGGKPDRGSWRSVGSGWTGISECESGDRDKLGRPFPGYGPFLWPTPSREVDFLPGHNSCYKRDVLLGYGDRLESMMESETVLHWDLRANGHRLYLEPAARVAHMNFSLWLSWIPAQFLNGRLFAGARAREMSHPRRWRSAERRVGAGHTGG